MMNYIKYCDGNGSYIVEILNETELDMLEVQKELIQQEYIITAVYGGRFIKCYKYGK